jgi:hypothetical protein
MRSSPSCLAVSRSEENDDFQWPTSPEGETKAIRVVRSRREDNGDSEIIVRIKVSYKALLLATMIITGSFRILNTVMTSSYVEHLLK